MRAVDVIEKKRDGETLSSEEISFFIEGFNRGDIPDYQVTAWAMAVLWQGMDARETADLTRAMIATGEQLDLSDVVPFAVDKHSTGGVGDKTTLVVEPAVAACGIPVGKMSGRGLGFSGGTLDKIESIPGFRVDLTTEQFKQQLADIGLVLCGQTADLAPADGKLYALRDVTGTVPSMPLIASSVMSKKLASGAQAIVLDVKVGLGAFMSDVAQAEQLAHLMVDIASQAGRKAVALISDMNQPLGVAVGNALEVREAIETLRGAGPSDFRTHCLEVAGHMLVLAGKFESLNQAKAGLAEVLDQGAALDLFRRLVEAQGGDPAVIEEPERLPSAAYLETLHSSQDGYVHQVHARLIGMAAVALGAGRERKGDPIDHAVGLEVLVKVGDRVSSDQPLCRVHANDESSLQQVMKQVDRAIQIGSQKIDPLPQYYNTIGV